MSYALAAYPNRYTVIQTGDRNGNTLPAAVVDGVVTHPFHYGCPPAPPELQTQCPRSSSILVTFSHLLPRTAQQPLFKTKAQPASRNRCTRATVFAEISKALNQDAIVPPLL
ncbi:hypothetical protein MCOR18_000190 [Pyricularia oryzae]|nr:hypothetical protein MCOR34_004573 [Pyricularia oryzae]KAI6439408.1 hypothetical protein MCOR22_007971 [Pyricularia oryzae]KAI6498545.1 hypothetical protein MCOR18_000190 [Pyricularia oryzae]